MNAAFLNACNWHRAVPGGAAAGSVQESLSSSF